MPILLANNVSNRYLSRSSRAGLHPEGEKRQGADDIIVFVGGVIPAQDYDFLYAQGVKGIYGPGTAIPDSARDVLKHIRAALKPV